MGRPLTKPSSPNVPIRVLLPPSSLPKQMESTLLKLWPARLDSNTARGPPPPRGTSRTAATMQSSLNQSSNLLPACPCYTGLFLSPPAHVPALNSFQQGVQERAVTGRVDPGPLTFHLYSAAKTSVFQPASTVLFEVPMPYVSDLRVLFSPSAGVLGSWLQR